MTNREVSFGAMDPDLLPPVDQPQPTDHELGDPDARSRGTEVPQEPTVGIASHTTDTEIERLARIAYNASVYSEEDNWWEDGLDEGEREEWRRAVRAVLREIQNG